MTGSSTQSTLQAVVTESDSLPKVGHELLNSGSTCHISVLSAVRHPVEVEPIWVTHINVDVDDDVVAAGMHPFAAA